MSKIQNLSRKGAPYHIYIYCFFWGTVNKNCLKIQSSVYHALFVRVSAIPGQPPAGHTYRFLLAQVPRVGFVTQTHNLHGRTGSCEIFPHKSAKLCESAAAWPGAGRSGQTQTSQDHMVQTQFSTPRTFPEFGFRLT